MDFIDEVLGAGRDPTARRSRRLQKMKLPRRKHVRPRPQWIQPLTSSPKPRAVMLEASGKARMCDTKKSKDRQSGSTLKSGVKETKRRSSTNKKKGQQSDRKLKATAKETEKPKGHDGKAKKRDSKPEMKLKKQKLCRANEKGVTSALSYMERLLQKLSEAERAEAEASGTVESPETRSAKRMSRKALGVPTWRQALDTSKYGLEEEGSPKFAFKLASASYLERSVPDPPKVISPMPEFKEYEPERSPRGVFRRHCEGAKLVPESLKLAKAAETLIKVLTPNSAETGVLDLSHYGIGNETAQALSHSLMKMPKLKTLDIRSNGLGREGLRDIFRCIPHNLLKLDISQNSMDGGKAGCLEALVTVVEDSWAIRELIMDGTGVGHVHLMKPLCEAVSRSGTLRRWDLRNNDIGDASARQIAKVIRKNKSLTVLSLDDNMIRSPGCVKIFHELKRNKRLRSLSISNNNLCLGYQITGVRTYGPEEEAARRIAAVLSRNHNLYHLDLSFNNFGVNSCRKFRKATKVNHSLCGLHLEGNCAAVDPRGFVEIIISERERTALTRAHGMDIDKTCWVCQRWSEVEISWETGISGSGPLECEDEKEMQVLVHLSCDAFKPSALLLSDRAKGCNVHKLHRVLPPGKLYYFFTVDRKMVTAGDQPRVAVPDSLLASIPYAVFGGLEKLNVIHVGKRAKAGWSYKGVSARPRSKFPVFVEVRPKTPWKRENDSIFAQFRATSKRQRLAMFENDWKYCGIPRTVRRQDDTGAVKRYYQKHYDYVRALYKMCVGHEVANIFQVGCNAVIQFCMKCDIIDDFNMKTNDINIIFSATNMSSNYVESEMNSSRYLARFEFMELLLRIAVAKYQSEDPPLSPPAALEKLFEEKIKPNAIWFDIYMWRSEILWTEEVATAFKRYEDQLRRIFADWRKRDSGDTKFMSLDEFTDLLEHCEIVDSTFSDNDARVAFVHAIQDVKDEMKTDRHTQMSFVEFVHGLAHVANIRDWSRSLLGNQLDVIERIERVIKALISGARRHAQTAGRNLAYGSVSPLDYTKSERKLLQVSPNATRSIRDSTGAKTEPALELMEGAETNSIVSEVFYRKIMADRWSEQMSSEIVSLTKIYQKCIARLEKEEEQKQKGEEGQGKDTDDDERINNGKKRRGRKRKGQQEEESKVSLDKVFRASVKKHSTSMLRIYWFARLMRWIPPRNGSRLEDEDTATDAADFLSTILHAMATCSADPEGFMLCREPEAETVVGDGEEEEDGVDVREEDESRDKKESDEKEKDIDQSIPDERGEEEEEEREGKGGQETQEEKQEEEKRESSMLLVPLPIIQKALLDSLPGSDDMINEMLQKAAEIAMPRATDSGNYWPGAAAAAAQTLAGFDDDDLSDTSDDESGGGGKGSKKESDSEHPKGNLAIHVDVALDLCLGTWYDLLQ